MLSCRIVTFFPIWQHFQGLSASHICLNGHLRSGPPAPVTVMLHAVYDFILNRATLSLKMLFFNGLCSHNDAHNFLILKQFNIYLSIVFISDSSTLNRYIPKRSHLRKSIRKWHMTSLTSHLSISQQKQWSDQSELRVECTRKVPWGDHSRGQHQWHQANSQWHFCQ